jgi:hypothetical protein
MRFGSDKGVRERNQSTGKELAESAPNMQAICITTVKNPCAHWARFFLYYPPPAQMPVTQGMCAGGGIVHLPDFKKGQLPTIAPIIIKNT